VSPQPTVRDLDLELDTFEGPFDLLLTLVLKEELAPSEVEVVRIIEAFIEQALPDRDGPGNSLAAPANLAVCGEFLVLVAALLELKARELFAGEDDLELDDLDPEEAAAELAERLAAYRRVKAGASWLQDRLAAESSRFFRLGPAPLAPQPARPLAQQDPGLLVAALRSLAAEPPAPSLAHLAMRLPPLGLFLERFRAALRRRRRFVFDEEVDGMSRIEQAVAFLALLELRKMGEIRLGQPAPLTPITVWSAA
jgi:segregation and condensation protein A